MNHWLEQCETWLIAQYQAVLGAKAGGGPMRFRWLSAERLTSEVSRADAKGLVVEDSEIGWLLFLLPYEPDRLDQQVNQSLGVRSRLLREANYTGNEKSGDKEDHDSSWRIGIVWLVPLERWNDWQHQILEMRRESGVADEISFDAVPVKRDDIRTALDTHGMPRLLLHTRALMQRSSTEAETWLSADVQVTGQLEGFSQRFDTPRARVFARELEAKVKAFQPTTTHHLPSEARAFSHFTVEHFRNLDALEIAAESSSEGKAQAIILYGPNGTGKSSLAEALSLAAFGTSLRLEKYLGDGDLRRPMWETYLKDYLTPIGTPNVLPVYTFGNGKAIPFTASPDSGKGRLTGVVLGQEDTREFTEMNRAQLAVHVLKGYSGLSEHLLDWLAKEEKSADETKKAFCRKHGLSSAITRSATAYDRLAQALLTGQLQRPSPEFLDCLRFWGRMADEDGKTALLLDSEWSDRQANAGSRLASVLAGIQERGGAQPDIEREVFETLGGYDRLAAMSRGLRARLEARIAELRSEIDKALSQVDAWGTWLAGHAASAAEPKADVQELTRDLDRLVKEKIELERTGKLLRGRLDLLDKAKQYLSSNWAAQHPDICPVCSSNVATRQGIDAVVSSLQQEINTTVQGLRVRFVDLQKQQEDLTAKIRAAGLSVCPLTVDEQIRLRNWLQPLMPNNSSLEEWLADTHNRNQLKADLTRMRVLPDAPQPHADPELEAGRLAEAFVALSQEADKALEDPQAIGAVRKEFEQRMEQVLTKHLPETLGRVWREITLALTTASWLLPEQPTLRLEQRAKALSIQTESDRLVRYIFNAAERHVLGLAWFFTHHLARRRFDEAWMLLDDPAQEMDQPSFREFSRFCETLLRLHQRLNRSFTLILALHQEDRALDAARATNGRLYVLGWAKSQQDASATPSVKKMVLLAPGFYPLKPDLMFAS